MEEVRNKVYNWSLELLKEGKELQGIILMLSTWNFAYFRYHIKTFDLTNFERILRECDFEYFRDKRFEDTDFNDEIILFPEFFQDFFNILFRFFVYLKLHFRLHCRVPPGKILPHQDKRHKHNLNHV